MSTNVTVISGNGSSTYDVIIGETSSTYEVISGLGSVDFEVSYGARGPAGLDSVTTNTDTTLSGYIYGNGTKIAGATLGSTSATASTLAIRDASGNLSAGAFLLPANGFAGTIDNATLTANRAYTLPNASGYVALTTNANGAVTNSEVYVKAAESITAGNAVYISGASGTNKIISKAQAISDPLSSKTLGLSLQNLATNEFGYVVTEGDITGLSINLGSGHGVNEGDPIWLSPTTPGGLLYGIANKPSAPNHLVFIGFVTRITGNTLRDIFVKVQNGYELDELHNVAISSEQNGQVLTYESSTQLWKNKVIPDASTTAKGIVELATVAESQAGTDSVRAVTPDGLPMRKVGTAWIGGDLTGNTRGANALDVQSLRDSVTQVANQLEGINYGIKLINNGTSSLAVGNSITINQTSAYSTQDPSVGCSVFGLNNSAGGGFSTVVGLNSSADGNGCTAIGLQTTAIGDIAGDGSSTAIGATVNATGNYNTAIGSFTEAVGPSGCTSIGTSNSALGDVSTAIGYSNSALGAVSTAIGYSNVARGIQNIIIGASCESNDENSLAIGNSCRAMTFSSTAIGQSSLVYNANTLRLNSSGSSPSYIRLHGNTGMCAMTVQNRSTEYDDAKRSQSVTITRSGTTATVSLNAHGYSVGALVIIAGASQAAYNGTKTILSVATNSFTYEVTGSPATPATGTITAVAGDGVERDNTLARGEFAIRRNGLQFILDYNDAGTVKNIILGTAT